MDDRDWIEQVDEAARLRWDQWPVYFAAPALAVAARDWVDDWLSDTPTARDRRGYARIDWSQ